MKADKNGFIDRGFTLNEQDFRRLVATSKEMLLKKGDEATITYLFKTKFYNGTIYETDSLDEILSLDNVGSGSIKMVETTISISDGMYRIRFNYNDPDFIDNEVKGITFSVFGEDRDWVFVTNSQIEERLLLTSKTSVFTPKIHFNSYLTIFLICVMSIMIYTLQDITSNKSDYPRYWDYEKKWEEFIEEDFDLIAELKTESEKKPNAKPIDVFIKYRELIKEQNSINENAKDKYNEARDKWYEAELNKREKPRDSAQWVVEILLFSLGIPILFWLYIQISSYVYPLYVFSWGDNKAAFEKKDNIRKYLLGTVIVGILVSFVAGILANSI